MNVANACNAEELSVRLCFLVNVRKASGRNVGGGSRIGSIVAICGLNAGGGGGGRCMPLGRGWRGVPNAGEEEKTFVSGTLCGMAMSVSMLCRHVKMHTSTQD